MNLSLETKGIRKERNKHAQLTISGLIEVIIKISFAELQLQ